MKKYFLIADDDETFCYVLKEQLVDRGFTVTTANDGIMVQKIVQKSTFDLIFLDLHMPGANGYKLLSGISEMYPHIPVIILTGQNDAKSAVECIKAGAFDYVVKPYNFEELMVVVARALEFKELKIKSSVFDQQVLKKGNRRIVGESPAMKTLISLCERAAKSDSNILIEGETGTGKELVAEFIHKHSSRSAKPFVVINCASLPDQLIESELFGYEKGAFTDAKSSKQGLVEIANGGTLFLDEIGEMSLTVQPKLLRFLENGEFRRVGGLSSIHSDVRVISATNRSLLEALDAKSFRKDLLFRLNVITLTVPPLRERPEDILLLSEYFLDVKSPVRAPKSLSDGAKQALTSYKFPGNIRELEHLIERAIIFSEQNLIHADALFLPQSAAVPGISRGIADTSGANDGILTVDELEKKHIAMALNLNNWEQQKTARQLGISTKTLYNKIKKYDLRQRND